MYTETDEVLPIVRMFLIFFFVKLQLIHIFYQKTTRQNVGSTLNYLKHAKEKNTVGSKICFKKSGNNCVHFIGLDYVVFASSLYVDRPK